MQTNLVEVFTQKKKSMLWIFNSAACYPAMEMQWILRGLNQQHNLQERSAGNIIMIFHFFSQFPDKVFGDGVVFIVLSKTPFAS